MIPYGFYLRAMFWNKKLFAEAGFDGPPETMQEFYDYSAKIAELDGKYGYCLRGGPGATNGYIMMMLNFLGENKYFNEDGTSTLDDPEGDRGPAVHRRHVPERPGAHATASAGASTRSSPASIPAPAPCSTRTRMR